MELIALKSSVITADSDLFTALTTALKKAKKIPRNGDVVIVTSKVISVVEGRTVSVRNAQELTKIAKNEADVWLGGTPYPFSITRGVLIPRSGIDESNTALGTAILWPRDAWTSAEQLRKKLAAHFTLKNIGVIITDSTCRPLRWGVTNIALAWAGFEGLTDERGKKDLFGRKLTVTRRAVADSLAAAAGALTGEAAESIPFVLARETGVTFTAKTKRLPNIQPHEDLFYPIYSSKFRKIQM